MEAAFTSLGRHCRIAPADGQNQYNCQSASPATARTMSPNTIDNPANKVAVSEQWIPASK